jgi:hypothetical protein
MLVVMNFRNFEMDRRNFARIALLGSAVALGVSVLKSRESKDKLTEDEIFTMLDTYEKQRAWADSLPSREKRKLLHKMRTLFHLK